MGQKTVLGKGLASLLPGLPMAEVVLSGATSAGPAVPVQHPDLGSKDRIFGISLVNVEEIEANPYQPRREFDEKTLSEMVCSIKAHGLIQPLIIRKNAEGKFQLIAGERRLRASRLAGLKQVPVVVRRSTDRESLELALIENIQRQDLNCIDEALAYLQLIQDFSLTQEEIAERVGKDRASVANFLRLLRLPELIIEDLKKGILSLGHGKVLLSLEDNLERMKFRNQIIEEKLSVRALEDLIDERKEKLEQTPVESTPDPLKNRMRVLTQELTHQWGVKVKIKGNDLKGKILFHYTSRGELDRLLNMMQNKNVWQEIKT